MAAAITKGSIVPLTQLDTNVALILIDLQKESSV